MSIRGHRTTLSIAFLCMAVACLVGELHLGSADVQLRGEFGDRLGFALSIEGDLNGDGQADLVVAAPNPGQDRVFVFFGPLSSPPPLTSAAADVTFTGFAGSEAGWAIDVADLTANGADDLVITAPSAAPGGHLYVLEGPIAAGTYAPGDAYADYAGYRTLGWSVDGGDFDGDGDVDLVVGDAWALDDTGAVWIVDGPIPPGAHTVGDVSRVIIRGEQPGLEGNLGRAVSAAGDVGGTGHDALLLGAHQATRLPDLPAAGAAYLFHEAPTGKADVAVAADAIVRGEWWIHNVGFSLGGRGDFNGDGYGDLLIGAPGVFCTRTARHPVGSTLCDISVPPSSAHVFFGGQKWTTYEDELGVERWIQVPLLEGEYTTTDADFSLYASHPDASIVPNAVEHATLGHAVAWTNSTGRPEFDDVVVGAPKINRAYLAFGHVPVSTPQTFTADQMDTVFYLGEHADEHAVASSHDPAAYNLYGSDAAGLAVAGGGDINGDGIEDVVVAAPGQLWFEDGPAPEGQVFIYFGSEVPS